jgi:hypothetical protein
MITCYLDSQDYSTLSDPKGWTSEKSQIRDALLNFAKEKSVKFVFSAAAISEAVPISPETSKLAELKAELLVQLCGTNALISFDRVVSAETEALAKGFGAPATILDPHGNWFPKINTLDVPHSPIKYMQEQMERALMETGMSRQQSRTAVRKNIKNGAPRGEFKKHMDSQNIELLAAEFSKPFPMKSEHAEMVVRFWLGRATEAEFDKALNEGLRDPHHMMKWFTTSHALASPISDIVRRPGRELGAHLRELVALAVRHAALLKEGDTDAAPMGKDGEILQRWGEQQDNQLVNLVQRVAQAKGISLKNVTPKGVDKFCPGISATIRSLYSSAWDNVAAGRKEELSDSQPVDALHAMYAPYVCVFRADRYMAPHIQKQVKRHGTIVVSRLSDLVQTLSREVASYRLTTVEISP